MREIGIRKVLGGKRKQLIFQFLAESTILVSIATALAVIAYPFLSNVFEQVVGKELIPITSFPLFAIGIPFFIIIIVGFIFQFTIALIVLIASFLVTKQIDYFFKKDLGYEKEHLISAATPRDWSAAGVQKMITIRNELQNLLQVANVSLSYEIPNGNNGGQLQLYRSNAAPESSVATQGLIIDGNFIETYQINLLAGSVFNTESTNAEEVLLNEKALKSLGFESPEMAIGSQIRLVDYENPLTVKGIVDNFHFESLHAPIKPQVYQSVSAVQYYRYLTIKLKAGNMQSQLDMVKQKWQELMPNAPFKFEFLDDTLANLYTNEAQLQKASYSAAVLAFIIVLLGVFGLVSLNVQKRIKEIGIRKVLGASRRHISKLFVKEFVVVLVFAILVAVPIAYYIISLWLQNYVVTSNPANTKSSQ